MTSSGVYDFTLSNAEIIIDAFSRCRIKPASLVRDDFIEARRSINLEMIEWNNRGVDLFQVLPFTVRLQANTAAYTQGTGVTNIAANCVSMLDVYLSQIDGGGTGVNTDRIMLPMSRDDYAAFPNKLQPGVPTMYWFQKQPVRQVTIYQPPTSAYAYPYYQMSGYYLSTHQTANLGGGETPDVDTLALDALIAKLAVRLADKYPVDEVVIARLERRAKEAWTLYAETNREDTPITILPAQGAFNGWASD